MNKLNFEIERDLPIREAMRKFRLFYVKEHLKKYEENKTKTAKVLKTSRWQLNYTLKSVR